MLRSIVHLTAAAVLLGAPALPAEQKGSDHPARVQLDAARQVRQKAFKKSGEEKRSILEASIAEYQIVLEKFGKQKDACAEAAFRIGEIERSLGDAQDAREAFEKVLAFGAEQPTFAARAQLELGHIARRADQTDQAIALYQKLLEQYSAQETQAVAALTWIGKLEDRRGQSDKAREIWLSLADRFPSQPVPAIRAADLAALSALKSDDLQTARQIMQSTQERFSEDNQDQAWWSPAVEEALGKMKAARKLQQLQQDG